jgi:hypothetical protein
MLRADHTVILCAPFDELEIRASEPVEPEYSEFIALEGVPNSRYEVAMDTRGGRPSCT